MRRLFFLPLCSFALSLVPFAHAQDYPETGAGEAAQAGGSQSGQTMQDVPKPSRSNPGKKAQKPNNSQAVPSPQGAGSQPNPTSEPTNSSEQATSVPVKREPVQVEVSDSRKSDAQRSYERTTQSRLDSAIKRIEAFKSSYDSLAGSGREEFLGLLQTSEGNRSAARTKLKQLKFISPNDWQSLTKGIDQALHDLEGSVDKADQWLKSHSTPQQ